MTDFTKLPIGTKVKCYLFGEGQIEKIDESYDVYKTKVRFVDGKLTSYTDGGFLVKEHAYPCLYLPEDFPIKDEPEFKVEPAVVKYQNIYLNRHGSYYSAGITDNPIEPEIPVSGKFIKTNIIEIQPERKFKKVITWEEVK